MPTSASASASAHLVARACPSLHLAFLSRRVLAGLPPPRARRAMMNKMRNNHATAAVAGPTSAPSPSPSPSTPSTPSMSSMSSGIVDVDDFATDPRPVMLYDGVCGLCNNGVDLALGLDSGARARLRFAALQSPAGQRLLARAGRAPDDISSVVLVKADGRAFIESEAIVEIGRVLGVFPAPLAALALALPSGGRDAAYRTVADNRYSIFGKRDVCRLTQGGRGVGGGDDPGRFIVE